MHLMMDVMEVLIGGGGAQTREVVCWVDLVGDTNEVDLIRGILWLGGETYLKGKLHYVILSK